MVFYLCVPALMGWGRGGEGRKKYLTSSGGGGLQNFFFFLN